MLFHSKAVHLRHERVKIEYSSCSSHHTHTHTQALTLLALETTHPHDESCNLPSNVVTNVEQEEGNNWLEVHICNGEEEIQLVSMHFLSLREIIKTFMNNCHQQCGPFQLNRGLNLLEYKSNKEVQKLNSFNPIMSNFLIHNLTSIFTLSLQYSLIFKCQLANILTLFFFMLSNSLVQELRSIVTLSSLCCLTAY